ncbi:MAG: DUF3783 domain-containing protein [Eubacteriales bacterium]|nr:DUF3783 domain-containing protein [Eubacteriales bacterium]
MKAEALIYNLKDNERSKKIKRYLNRIGINIRQVQAPDFLHPLGFLFEIPGFSRNTRFNLGGNFTEEMLVMKDFTDKQMNDFFQFFRTNDLEPISLKAVLTPVNQYWDSLKLHQELLEEHRAFQK